MSLVIEGVTYNDHSEYFAKYPWKRAINKRKNLPLYMAKIDVPCADCGLRFHPMVMTLDHTDRSTGYRTHTDIRRFPSGMKQYPTETFQAELDKCEAVCMNCHAFREFKRDGYNRRKRWLPYEGLSLKGAMLNGQTRKE